MAYMGFPGTPLAGAPGGAVFGGGTEQEGGQQEHGFEEIAELAPCQQLNGHIAVEFVTCRSSTAAF